MALCQWWILLAYIIPYSRNGQFIKIFTGPLYTIIIYCTVSSFAPVRSHYDTHNALFVQLSTVRTKSLKEKRNKRQPTLVVYTIFYDFNPSEPCKSIFANLFDFSEIVNKIREIVQFFQNSYYILGLLLDQQNGQNMRTGVLQNHFKS